MTGFISQTGLLLKYQMSLLELGGLKGLPKDLCSCCTVVAVSQTVGHYSRWYEGESRAQYVLIKRFKAGA